MTWSRTSDGDYPTVGSIISMVIYREEDTSVVVYQRMSVAVVIKNDSGHEIYGPALPGEADFALPGRPEPLFGRAVFWRYVE